MKARWSALVAVACLASPAIVRAQDAAAHPDASYDGSMADTDAPREGAPSPSVAQPTSAIVQPPRTTNTPASAARSSPAASAEQRLPVALFGLIEADYIAPSSEAESLAGFVLHRARMGFTARPLRWMELRFSGDYARETVAVIDAFASLKASDELEVNVGFQRVPLSPTARDAPEFTLPVPDRAMVINALSFARDLGIEAHWSPRRVPFEAWARVGNGSGNPLGPETSVPTGIARLDVVLGRANVHSSREQLLGLRAGVAAMVTSVPDRIGIGATTPVGFLYFRPVPIEGMRARVTAHMHAFAGPVMLAIEGGFARDGRSRDTDGNPMTPRVAIDAVYTAGASAELSVMITGHRRHADEWPQYSRPSWLPASLGAIELAARAERLSLSTGASDVVPSGAWAGAIAARWWVNAWLVGSVAAYWEQFDRAPLEAPETTTMAAAVLRLTGRVQ